MSAINTHIIVEAAVKANGKWIEITEYVTKFSHILSNVEASSASITLNSDHMNYKLDDFKFLATGQLIVFRYGYLNQEGLLEKYNISQAMSKRYVAVIGDINYQYGSQGSKFILKLISKGYYTKKIVTQKIWKKVTASDIARQVARLHDLKPFIDETNFVYGSFPQGNMSNYDLLRRLAQLEPGFVFFIRSNELHFKKVGTYKSPIYRIDVRGAIVTDLNLVWQDIEEAKKIGTIFTDENGKYDTRETLKNLGTIGEVLLDVAIGDDGIFKGLFKTNIFEQVQEEQEAEAAAAAKNKTEEQKKKEAAELAKKEGQNAIENLSDKVVDSFDASVNTLFSVGDKVIKQIESATQGKLAPITDMLRSKRRELTADVTLVGVPYLVNDTKVILNNIHSRFEGEYYIEEVTHRIEESYMTSLRLNKHGIRRLDEQDPISPETGETPPTATVDKEIKDSEAEAVVSDNGEYRGNNVSRTTNNYTEEESLPDSEK